MASKGKAELAPPCSVCGGELNDAWECTICGTKHDPNGGRDATPPPKREDVVAQFTRISGVGESKARALYDNGYTTLDALREAKANDLARVPGIGDKLAETIHKGLASMGDDGGGANAGLQSWLAGGDSQGLETWLGSSKPSDPKSDNALRTWLTGGADDLSAWLGPAPTPAEPAATSEDQARLLEEHERELREKEAEIQGLNAELASMKKNLDEVLGEFKSGKFDPIKYVEDTARLNRDLQTEVKIRKQLEQEIEHIKKGSIAVIKYLKTQQVKTASPDMRRKLAEEGNARVRLEGELQKTQEILAGLREQVDAGLEKMKPDAKAMKQRELELMEKEATIKAKEDELKRLEEAAASGEVDLTGSGISEELRSRLQEELREKEQEFLNKEEELKKRIIGLEDQVSRFQIDQRLREESEALSGKSEGEISATLAEKMRQIQSKEKSIEVREQEITRLKEELQFTKDELSKTRQQVSYKDEELIRREEDLLYREKLLNAERSKLDQAKADGFSVEEKGLKDRLEQLKGEINQKEEEVRAKEKYLKAKMEELRLREQGLIEEEIEAREEERALEVTQEKIKTGTPRLDDLLLGGIPFGSNVSIYGPAYVGKEVIANAFIAEGLKKGVPCVMVITDKTPSDLREEMKFVLPGFEEYERLGLVKYVDAYSRSMGSEEQDQYAVYVDDPTDHESILKTVDTLAKEFKKKHDYYRLCFRSISTLIAYLDPTTTFRFLQPFAGRRKRDQAVSLYLIEKGMHGEQEIQMLGSVMDGSVEIKVEQLKSYLAVKGISDVQSRAWIRYTYSKGAVNIGSFSLDHIR